MLHINDVTLRLGGRVILDGAILAVARGHKVGLVGRNGAGKSTLVRLIAGDIAPDEGTVTLARGTRIGRVAQEAPSGPASLIEIVLAADGERSHLLTEAESAREPACIADIHHRLAAIEARAAPARAATILAGLGFDQADQRKPPEAFSGGWRMRVALAAALAARPDLLLLDEPTNHLDLEATLWLEGWLARWTGTLVLISHERDILNRAVDEIAHLEDGRLTLYAGGYDRFERTRREGLVRRERLRRRQADERRHLQAFIDRFRSKATKARQAQSRIKRLARMEPIASMIEDPTRRFVFPEPPPLAPPLITLEAAAAGYDDATPVLTGLELRIDPDDRIALLGANGNGKSTMIKLLAGRLAPMAGKLTRARRLGIGYFAQHQSDELDHEATPLVHAQRLMTDAPETRVRAHLGRFGFAQEAADVGVANLSGGEKARLLFALMSTAAPQIMLLDEPTNHLDVDAREALVEALNDYRGAIVLVSHDSHLIDVVCDRLWLVADGTCRPFDGDLEDYRQSVLDEARRGNRNEGPRAGSAPSGRREARQARAALRVREAPHRRAARDAEAMIESLAGERDALLARLADPALYGEGGGGRVAALQVRLARVRADLAQAEDAWLAAHEAIEDMGRGGGETEP